VARQATTGKIKREGGSYPWFHTGGRVINENDSKKLAIIMPANRKTVFHLKFQLFIEK